MTRPLRAVTWNVHSCRGRDRRCDPRRTASVLDALQVEVAALQEVDERTEQQLEALARGAYVLEGPTLRGERGAYGNAIITAEPPDEVRFLDLTVAAREPRGAIACRLPRRDLWIVCTHLGLRGFERARQVQKLLELIEGLPGPALLLGDLNEWRARGALAPLARRLLPLPAPRTFPARLPTFRLDRAFATREGLTSARAVVPTLRDARIASDHLPVVYEVSFAERRMAA